MDEIQHVAQFELVADSLFIQPNIDLYLTGSNAYFLSSDLATNLTDRYVEMEVLPFSIKEYRLSLAATKQDLSPTEAFNQFQFSALPYLSDTDSMLEKIEYLRVSILQFS